MIDLALLRENPEKVIALLQKKDPHYNVARLIELDETLRKLRVDVETLRHEKNELAQKGKQGVTDELRAKSITLGKELKDKSALLETVEKEFNELYLFCPNLLLDEVPAGGKESNLVVKTYGQKKEFNFPIKNHVELGEALGWFDFHTASVMTASNFVFYKGEAVKLIYALKMFMLKHNNAHGYSLTLPPYLVNEKSLETASNFPKFREQVYSVEKDELYLAPTSEVNLANVYRDAILAPTDLPIRLTAASSCFRREAGSYGAHERGLIRIHQFEKCELFTFCEPEQAESEQQRMLDCAESILQKLGLHYRVSLLAAQDTSFPSAKTYDLEVWLPGQGAFYEVSSISNCTDFQARRGSIRYRKMTSSKTSLVATLNGSSLALPRLIVAIMETYQQPDGSIIIPEVLKEYGLY